MKPYEQKAYEVGKNGGTVPTNKRMNPTRMQLDRYVIDHWFGVLVISKR